jgi:DNA polymerase III sliding clamp (beta) subunit (PCNA family)
MKFPKLDLVLIDFNSFRPVLSFVKVTKEFTYASDANSLVRHKTSELFDEDFCNSISDNGLLIPASAIKEIRKTSTLRIEHKNGTLELIRKGQYVGNIVFVLPNSGDFNYPDAEKIIPKQEEIKPLSCIGLSAESLNNTSEAMGIDLSLIKMEFTGEEKPIILTAPGSDYPSVLAILMPVRINY